MKRILLILLSLATLVMVGCKSDPVSYTPDQLYGKWQRGSEYYRYDSNMKGVTWDTSDDVSEEEAQPFEWSVSGDQLTVIHIMEMGGRIPKVYTITSLTSNILKYQDNYNQQFVFTRVIN